MTAPLRILSIAALLAALAAPAAAQPEPVVAGPEALIASAALACAEPPPATGLSDCLIAERELAAGVVAALLKLGASGQRDAGVPLALAFAEWPFAEVRFAAAAALGGLFPAEAETPVLARLLNDPVPVVRNAALAALRQSSDPVARRLAERAVDPQGRSPHPDGPIVDPAALPTALPADAEPVRFTADAEAGVAAFLTDQPAAAVLEALAAEAGQDPVDLDGLAALFGISQAGPPIDVNDPMAVMRYMMELQERLEGLPEAEWQAAYFAALQALAPTEPSDDDPVARWRDSATYDAPMAIVLPGDAALEVPFPTHFAVVYRDLTLDRTAVALQWVLPAILPQAPVPEDAPEDPVAEPVEPQDGGLFGRSPPPERVQLTDAEVEGLLWEALQADDTVSSDVAAFLSLFPDSPNADAAADLRDRLPDEVSSQDGSDSAGGTTEATEQAQQQSSLFGRPVDHAPALAIDQSWPLSENLPIVVSYNGMPDTRSQWIAVCPAGSGDNSWGSWAYASGADGRLTLPGQAAGDYEIRAYLESPREVIARLAVTVAVPDPDAPALQPALETDSTAYKIGEEIPVRWSGMPGLRSDWITVVPVGTPDTTWGDWAYTDRMPAGALTLPGQDAPGDYEIRAYLENPREVVARLAITITP